MPETTTDPKPRKKAGAPLENAPGRVPYHEVDRLLVFGELVDGPEGEPPFVVYPSFRAIARRYGVNHSVIAGYAKRRDCLERREQAQQRVTARVDDKLVEQRATVVAVGKGDAVRVIDTFIRGFEAASKTMDVESPMTPRGPTSTGPLANCTDTAATRAMRTIPSRTTRSRTPPREPPPLPEPGGLRPSPERLSTSTPRPRPPGHPRSGACRPWSRPGFDAGRSAA